MEMRPIASCIEHVKCITGQCIKPFEGQKGGSSKPLRIPPAYGPEPEPYLKAAITFCHVSPNPTAVSNHFITLEGKDSRTFIRIEIFVF